MVIEFSFPSLNLSELCLRALTRVEWHFPGLGKSLRNRILELPKKNSLIILSHLDFMSFNGSISNNYLSCRNFIAFHIPLQLFRTLAPTRTHALHHTGVRPLPPMHTHTHTHEHTHPVQFGPLMGDKLSHSWATFCFNSHIRGLEICWPQE